MQAGVELGRAPVTAVECGAAVHVERSGNRVRVAAADHEQHIVRHGVREMAKNARFR